MASVRVDQADLCGSCGAKILCHPEKDEFGTILVQNNLNAQVGQRVLISEKSDLLLKISILQYGIPLVGFLLGIFFVYLSGLRIKTLPPELSMFIGGLLGLLSAGIFSHFWARTIAGRGGHYCKISEIIG